MTGLDALHLAFGALAGVTLIAMILFAGASMKARGMKPAIGSLAASILALVMLLGAAAQLDSVLRGLASAKPPVTAKASSAKASPNANSSSASTAKSAPAPVDPKAQPVFALPKLEPNKMLAALLRFASSLAFLAALVGGVAAALLAWVTRDDSSDSEADEAEPLADIAAEPAL